MCIASQQIHTCGEFCPDAHLIDETTGDFYCYLVDDYIQAEFIPDVMTLKKYAENFDPEHICTPACALENVRNLYICRASGRFHECGAKVCKHQIIDGGEYVCTLTKAIIDKVSKPAYSDYVPRKSRKPPTGDQIRQRKFCSGPVSNAPGYLEEKNAADNSRIAFAVKTCLNVTPEMRLASYTKRLQKERKPLLIYERALVAKGYKVSYALLEEMLLNLISKKGQKWYLAKVKPELIKMLTSLIQKIWHRIVLPVLPTNKDQPRFFKKQFHMTELVFTCLDILRNGLKYGKEYIIEPFHVLNYILTNMNEDKTRIGIHSRTLPWLTFQTAFLIEKFYFTHSQEFKEIFTIDRTLVTRFELCDWSKRKKTNANGGD